MPSLSSTPEEEHAWSKVLKCSTRLRGASPQGRCSPIVSKAFRFKSFRCRVPPAFCGSDAAQWTAEGIPEHTAGQPSHSDYLPLFQWGLAPVSMTTWRQLCLVGLDIQRGAGKGCTGATQQMHLPQWDTHPLRYSLQACQTARLMIRLPLALFFTPYLCSYPLCGSLTLLWLVVTSWSLLLNTCSCLCVTGCLCLDPAAGHELIIRTQGFSVLITKLWHHHITHSCLTDKLYNRAHWFKGKRPSDYCISIIKMFSSKGPRHIPLHVSQSVCMCVCVNEWVRHRQKDRVQGHGGIVIMFRNMSWPCTCLCLFVF